MGRDERLLRADWIGERRRWEEEMRRAACEAGDEEVDFSLEGEGGGWEGFEVRGDGDGEVVENAPSPTEEREIEALLELLDDAEPAERGQGIGDGDGDSQEWDEVFMMLSQQDQPVERPLLQEDGDVEMS
jgi:hypothetical protein